ncbi:hypothetical protein NXS19_008064 [Fusarium pseudograminearum]|nr:hypothetical protein NXS19_008064 [Fusarium pseudograminearum]
MMKEKASPCPSSTKQAQCLTHNPSTLDSHKLDPNEPKSSPETSNSSSETTAYREKKRLTGIIFHALLRVFQFTFAVVVAILYGVDLKQATKSNARAHPSWVYAEVVAGLSMISCMMQWLFMTALCAQFPRPLGPSLQDLQGLSGLFDRCGTSYRNLLPELRSTRTSKCIKDLNQTTKVNILQTSSFLTFTLQSIIP